MEQEESKPSVGEEAAVPQTFTPPPIPAEPAETALPEVASDEANTIVPDPAPAANVLDDEPPAVDIDLPTQVVEEPEQNPTPDNVADAPAQPESEEPKSEAAVNSIWDDCEILPDASENLRNMSPVFSREDAPEGVDIAFGPTSSINMATIAQGKEMVGEEDLIYMLNMQRAAMVAPTDDVMIRRQLRSGADWVQTIKVVDPDGKPLSISFLPSAPKKPGAPGEVISGAEALERFMVGTTMGAPVTVPLTNTGIWVRLSPAGASFLAELDRKLAYARMQAGLDTNGITGSTDDLIFREIINEAALRLVTATNYPVSDPLDLRDIIDDEDHKTLSWALAKVLYPKGIMVSIPCIDNACGQVDTFRANPARMHFIDRSKLNEKQLKYLSRGISRRMSPDDVADYKSQFAKTSKYSVRLMNREFIFRSPTIAEKLQIGRAWLSTVNQAVDVSMAATPDDDMKRNDIIQQITSIEQVCRYAHYVAEIRVYNGDEEVEENYYTIQEESAIRSILRALSTSPDLVETLISGIDDFLVEIGATIIGYPNASCSKCNHANVPDKMKNRLLLPFDPDTGFFILAQRKISQAGGSPLTDLTTFGVGNLAAVAQENAQMVSLGQDQY